MWTKTKEKYNYFFLLFLLSFHVIFKFTKTTYFNLLKNNLFSSAFDLIIEKHTFNISPIEGIYFLSTLYQNRNQKGQKNVWKKCWLRNMPYKKSELRFIMKSVSYLKISRINKQIRDFMFDWLWEEFFNFLIQFFGNYGNIKGWDFSDRLLES